MGLESLFDPMHWSFACCIASLLLFAEGMVTRHGRKQEDMRIVQCAKHCKLHISNHA